MEIDCYNTLGDAHGGVVAGGLYLRWPKSIPGHGIYVKQEAQMKGRVFTGFGLLVCMALLLPLLFGGANPTGTLHFDDVSITPAR